MASTNFKTLARQIHSSRIKYVYVALCEIRKKYMKDVPVLIEAGLVRRILELVRIRDTLEEQYRSKVIEMSMSILGNLCMDDLTRKEVLKEKGLSYLVELYDESECVELLTRVCRCLSNMLLDPRSWKLVACVTVMEKTVKLLKDSEKEENKLTYIRAIRLLGQTDSSVQKLVQQNAVGGVMKYIDDNSTKLKEAAFRCIHSLSNHRCCSDFASQVKTSGKLSTLLELVKKHDVRTFNLIIRLCEHHSFRAEFGNLGGIDILLEIVSTKTGLDNHWVFDSLSVLCLCCKEVVNRVKLKDKNILPVIMKSLSDDRYSSLHPRIVSALICFLYDDAGFEILLECDLVPIVMRRLRQYYEPNREPGNGDQETKGKMAATSNQKPECSEQETSERIEAKPDEKIAMELENVPKSVESVVNNTENITSNATDGTVESTLEEQEEVREKEIASGNKFDPENIICEIIDGEKEVADKDLDVEIESYAENQSEIKQASSSTKPVYSMHSPTYQSGSTWNYEDDNNVTCIARFTPPPFSDGINNSSYSPMSNSSYYSPSEGSPGYNLSSPETSPHAKSSETGSRPLSRSNTPKYSSIVCQLYKSPASPDYGNSSPTRMSRHDYDCYSSGYTSMSPGGKSPSPSGLFEISEDPATFTYSPVHSDAESEVEDMDNDMHEVKENESVMSQKVAETFKKFDEDSKIEDGNKQMGRNIEISRKYFETKTGNENNDDKKENLSETRSGMRKEENDERNETTDVVKAFNELIDKDDDVGSGIDFSKVFLELNKSEQCVSISNKRKSPDEADRITEFNILILLSRVSQMTEPTKHLVTMEVMDGLLDYIGKMDSPLARCSRLLSRIFRNPLCFRSVLSLHVPVLIWDKILQHENLETVVDSIKDHRRKVYTMSDRFTDTSLHQASKRRKTSEDQSFSYKGIDHKQEVDFCETGSSAMAFLEDLSGVVDSNFGRGMIEKLLYSVADNQKTDICINLLYITWTQASRQYLFHQRFIDTITQLLSPSEDINSQQFISAVNGLRVLFHVMNTKTKYQHSMVSKTTARGCHGNRTKSSTNSKTDEKTINDEDIVSTEETNTKEALENCSLNQVNDLDIVFIVEGQKVYANKSTLCSKSEIFSAMLEGHYSEARLSEIPVKDCPKQAFEIVIHYLHGCASTTCEIMKNLYTQAVTLESASVCIALLNESHKYLLHDLHSLAMNCLLSRYIIPESAFSAFKYAVLHRNDKLMKACVSSVFYDSKCCTEAVKACQEFLTSRYSGLFFHSLTDILLE